jgi:hypothetical protein
MIRTSLPCAQKLSVCLFTRSPYSLVGSMVCRHLGVYEKSKFFIPEEKELLLFKIYKEIHGNLIIKQRFIVPASEPWPDWSHGFKLGNFTSVIRKKKKTLRLHPNTEAFFSKLGFLWDFPTYNHDRILQAFQIYKVQYGNINKIPYTFEVPKDDFHWPRDTWGVKLGQLASRYRKQYRKEKKPRRKVEIFLEPAGTLPTTAADREHFQTALEELGFHFELQKQNYTFSDVVQCLHIYQSIHGDLLVPQAYRIGGSDKRYPKDMRGKPLGQVVSKIRSKGLYKEHQEELLTMGFEFFPLQTRCEKIYAAIKQYIHVNQLTILDQNITRTGEKTQILSIPSKFVIPYNDASYDPSFWGLNIGTIVSDIRNKGTFAHYREKWMELGIISKGGKTHHKFCCSCDGFQ